MSFWAELWKMYMTLWALQHQTTFDHLACTKQYSCCNAAYRLQCGVLSWALCFLYISMSILVRHTQNSFWIVCCSGVRMWLFGGLGLLDLECTPCLCNHLISSNNNDFDPNGLAYFLNYCNELIFTAAATIWPCNKNMTLHVYRLEAGTFYHLSSVAGKGSVLLI